MLRCWVANNNKRKKRNQEATPLFSNRLILLAHRLQGRVRLYIAQQTWDQRSFVQGHSIECSFTCPLTAGKTQSDLCVTRASRYTCWTMKRRCHAILYRRDGHYYYCLLSYQGWMTPADYVQIEQKRPQRASSKSLVVLSHCFLM